MQDNSDLITVKESFIVVLDSRNGFIQNEPYNSSVKFQFEGSLYFSSNDYIQLTFSVNSFSCPNSIYIINETNNLLSLTINSTTTDYYIDYGNYNIDNFKNYLQSILPGFTITYNKTNYKYTLAHSTYDFQINSNSTIYEIMGFNDNTTYTSSNKILILPFPCNFNGLQNLNILLDNINTNNLDSFHKTQSSVIQSIPIDVNKSVINYVKTNDIMIPIKVNFIDDLEIMLIDDKNNLVNLNNQHFNLTLQFTILKDIQRFKNSFHHILHEN